MVNKLVRISQMSYWQLSYTFIVSESKVASRKIRKFDEKPTVLMLNRLKHRDNYNFNTDELLNSGSTVMDHRTFHLTEYQYDDLNDCKSIADVDIKINELLKIKSDIENTQIQSIAKEFFDIFVKNIHCSLDHSSYVNQQSLNLANQIYKQINKKSTYILNLPPAMIYSDVILKFVKCGIIERFYHIDDTLLENFDSLESAHSFIAECILSKKYRLPTNKIKIELDKDQFDKCYANYYRYTEMSLKILEKYKG